MTTSMMVTKVSSFAEIEADFRERVQQIVWCNMATIDTKDRPRSRVMHPLWDGTTGWITGFRNQHKARHIAHNPYVSLAYVSPANPVYIDCKAEWVDDLEHKQHVWQLGLASPEPYGFDSTPTFGSVDNPEFILLKLTPWRIELGYPPGKCTIWHA